MAVNSKEIIIPKEEAVFWLDRNGRWHNEHGEFQHSKIIKFFHASIKRDANGYYLGQTRDGFREKVYFRYEDTALFAVDVIAADDVNLVLNTRRQTKLKPTRLFTKDENLYMQNGPDKIKFIERGLMKISDFLAYEDDRYFIKINGRRYQIKDGSS